MASIETALTDIEKAQIKSMGGIPIGEDWGMVRFHKKNKPNRTIKKLLKERGYKITNASGSKLNLFMDFVLVQAQDS